MPLLLGHRPSRFSFQILVLVSIISLISFLYLDSRVDRTTASQDQESLGIYDEFTPPRHIPPLALSPGDNHLSIPIHAPYPQITITLYYRCQLQCPQLWLKLPDVNSATPLEFLIDHPIFHRYPMFHVTDQTFFLYQPTFDYPSPQAFLSQPPSTFYADPDLIRLFFSHTSARSLTAWDYHHPPAYIFTTFTKPRFFGDWYQFTRSYQVPIGLSGSLEATVSAYPGPQGMPSVQLIVPPAN